MTVTLNLPPELEQRLRQEADRRGLTADEFTLQLLDRHFPSRERRLKAVAILQSWLDEDDAEEQKNTGEYLVRQLDEDRWSERKLFPPEL